MQENSLQEVEGKKDQQSDDDGGSVFEDIGVLFDENRRGTTRRHQFRKKNDTETDPETEADVIQVAVNSIDDDPGSLQSGNYLWPGAMLLSKYLVENSPAFLPRPNPKSILELGAGTAMVSLVALQLYHTSLQCMFITDHDRSTLERARDNYETTLQDLYEQATNDGRDVEEQQFNVINEIGSISVEFQSLEWGEKGDIDILRKTARDHVDPTVFDVVLMSDVIYSRDVVSPLFATATSSLNRVTGVILLSQSFPFDEETENEISDCCKEDGLTQSVLFDRKDGYKIRKFMASSAVEMNKI